MAASTRPGREQDSEPGRARRSRGSLETYATVLFVLGMTDRLAELADPKADRLGLALDEERLPKRVRTPRRASVK